MKVFTPSTEVFACYEKSCAPPPVGAGGSGKGGRKGAVGRAAVANQVAGTRAKMQSDKAAGSSYGTDKGKGIPKVKGSKMDPATSKAVQKAISAWGKSGKPGDQRDEKATARALTNKYGTRGTGVGKNIKKTAPVEKQSAAYELTKKFGSRRG